MIVRSIQDDLKKFVRYCKSHNYDGLKSMMETRHVNPWKVIVATAILDTTSERKHSSNYMSYWTKRIKCEISQHGTNINSPVGHMDFYLAYEFASNAKLSFDCDGLNDCLVASTIKDYVKSHKPLFDATPFEKMVSFESEARDEMNNVLFDLNITGESLNLLSKEMELHFSRLEDCIELYMNSDINPESELNEIGGELEELEIGESWKDGSISAVLDCIKQSLITQKEGLSTIIRIARKSPIFDSIKYHAEVCFSTLLKSGKDDLRSDKSNSLNVPLPGMIRC